MMYGTHATRSSAHLVARGTTLDVWHACHTCSSAHLVTRGTTKPDILIRLTLLTAHLGPVVGEERRLEGRKVGEHHVVPRRHEHILRLEVAVADALRDAWVSETKTTKKKK